MGVYQDGRLQYVGHVGGGFDHEKLARVYRLMHQHKTSKSPFQIIPCTNEPVQWLKPLLVCEVKFAEWTRDRRLRQPIFLALRDDRDPAQCVYERQHDSGSEVVDVEKRVSLRAAMRMCRDWRNRDDGICNRVRTRDDQSGKGVIRETKPAPFEIQFLRSVVLRRLSA